MHNETNGISRASMPQPSQWGGSSALVMLSRYTKNNEGGGMAKSPRGKFLYEEQLAPSLKNAVFVCDDCGFEEYSEKEMFFCSKCEGETRKKGSLIS